MASRTTTQDGDVALAATWGGTPPATGDSATIAHTCTQTGYAFPAVLSLTIADSGSLTLTGENNSLPTLTIINGGRLVLASGSGTLGDVLIADQNAPLSTTPIACDGGTYTAGNLVYAGSASNVGTPAICRMNAGALTVGTVLGQQPSNEAGFQPADGIHIYGGVLTAATASGSGGASGYYGQSNAGGHGIRAFGGRVLVTTAYGGSGGDGQAGSDTPTAGGSGGHGVYAAAPPLPVSITIGTSVFGGNGGNGGDGAANYYAGGDGGTGGDGMHAVGANVAISFAAVAHGGRGGEGGRGGHAGAGYDGASGGAGGRGGHALFIGDGVLVECGVFADPMNAIRAGNGGDGGDNAENNYASGGAGGEGGDGIHVGGAPHADAHCLGAIRHGSNGHSGNAYEYSYGFAGAGGVAGAGVRVAHAAATLVVGEVAGSDWESTERGFYCVAGAVRPKGSISGYNAGDIVLTDQHALFAGLVEWQLARLSGYVILSDVHVLVPGKFYMSAAAVRTQASAFVLAHASAQAMVVPNIPVIAYHDYPLPADVRAGVVYGDGSLTGALSVAEPSLILFRD